MNNDNVSKDQGNEGTTNATYGALSIAQLIDKGISGEEKLVNSETICKSEPEEVLDLATRPNTSRGISKQKVRQRKEIRTDIGLINKYKLKNYSSETSIRNPIPNNIHNTFHNEPNTQTTMFNKFRMRPPPIVSETLQQQPVSQNTLPQQYFINNPIINQSSIIHRAEPLPVSPVPVIVPTEGIYSSHSILPSCLYCRENNQYCNRNSPTCSNCLELGIPCQYQYPYQYTPVNIISEPQNNSNHISNPSSFTQDDIIAKRYKGSELPQQVPNEIIHYPPSFIPTNFTPSPLGPFTLSPIIKSSTSQNVKITMDTIDFEIIPTADTLNMIYKSTLLSFADIYFKLFNYDFPIISPSEFLTYLNQFTLNPSNMDQQCLFELFMILSIGSKSHENSSASPLWTVANNSISFTISQIFFKQALGLCSDEFWAHKSIISLKRLILLGIYSLLEISELPSWEISGKLGRLITLLDPRDMKHDNELKVLCSNIYILEGLVTSTLNKSIALSDSYLIDDTLEHSIQLRIRQLEILIMKCKRKNSGSISLTISYADRKSIEAQLIHWLRDSNQRVIPSSNGSLESIKRKRDYTYLLVQLHYYSPHNEHSQNIIIENCKEYFDITLALLQKGNVIIGWISLYRALNVIGMYLETIGPSIELLDLINTLKTCLIMFNYFGRWKIASQVTPLFQNLIQYLHIEPKSVGQHGRLIQECFSSYTLILKEHSIVHRSQI
ncbi:uncharacterized protein RJT21DRAFT_120404 [Scheffersomyces amazonensis]|uniref:uncharacterized protein n=1 Tax=Scheffersomyces amazonensis TaxID=1078765 RepID=UPI00315DD354